MKNLLLAFAVVASLAACKKNADTSGFEKSVKSDLDGMGFKDAKVSCPKDVAMKEGTTFTCTVTIDKKDYKLVNTIGPVDKDNNASIANQEWPDGTPPDPAAATE